MSWPRPGSSERLGAAGLCLLVASLVVGAGEARLAGAAAGGAAMYLFFELAYPAIGYAGALLAAAAFCVAPSTAAVLAGGGRRVLLLPLLLLAVLLATGAVSAARGPAARHRLVLGLLALTLAAAFYTSYSALFFLVLPFLVWRESGRTRAIPHLVSLAGAAALCGAVLLRNRLASGFFFGVERGPSTRTLPANVADVLRALYDQVDVPRAAWVLIALGTVALVALGRRRSDAATGPPAGDYADALTRIASRCALVFAVGLTLVATVQRVDLSDVRRIAPCVTLAVLVLAVEAGRRWRGSAAPLRDTAIFAACVLVLGAGVARGVGYGVAPVTQRPEPSPAGVPLLAEDWIDTQLGLAEGMLRDGRYGDAMALVDEIMGQATDRQYRVAKVLATAHAGLGEVDVSYAYTRECLRLDRARAEMEISQIATPYFADPSRFPGGVEYYERLKRDLPQAWWIYENVANLAERLGQAERAASNRARAAQLKRRTR